MSIQAANLFGSVSIQGAATSAAALRGVGTEVTTAQRVLSAMSGAGNLASKGLGLVERGANGVSNAASHLKGVVGGAISGPLGIVGLGSAVLGVGAEFEASVGKVTDLGKTLLELHTVTGGSYEDLSGLIAVGEKFGVSADTMSSDLERLTKNIGVISAKASTEKTFVQEFGFSFRDANGHILDTGALMAKISDYMTNTNIPATQRAALAAKLFGKSYADLAPILALGSQGLADAKAAAAALGETLTGSDAASLANYGSNMRDLSGAVNGLQLQIGLHLIPIIGQWAKAGTDFLEHGGTQQIIGMLESGIKFAQQVGGVLTGTVIPALVGFGHAASTAWNDVPAPIRDLLVKGIVADKTMKFLFGFDPATTIGGIIGKQLLSTLAGGLGSVFSSVLGKLGGSAASTVAGDVGGALGVQKVFVVNMAEGGLGGAGGGAAGGAEEAAGGIGIATIAVAAAAVVASAIAVVLAVKFADDNAKVVDLGNKVVAQTSTYVAAQTTSATDIVNSLNGINAQSGGLLNQIALNVTNGFNGGKDKLDVVKAALQARLDQMVALGDRTDKSADTIAANQLRQNSVWGDLIGKEKDDLVSSGAKTTGAVNLVHTAVNAAQAKAAAQAAEQLNKLQAIKDKDSALTVNLTTSISGDVIQRSTIKLKSGVSVT